MKCDHLKPSPVERSVTAVLPQGVTYCGESAASSLTMANVPWHEEVVRFVQELVALLPDYEIACEHEHSNCLLIGHKKVRGCKQACARLPPLPFPFLLFCFWLALP